MIDDDNMNPHRWSVSGKGPFFVSGVPGWHLHSSHLTATFQERYDAEDFLRALREIFDAGEKNKANEIREALGLNETMTVRIER